MMSHLTIPQAIMIEAASGPVFPVARKRDLLQRAFFNEIGYTSPNRLLNTIMRQ